MKKKKGKYNKSKKQNIIRFYLLLDHWRPTFQRDIYNSQSIDHLIYTIYFTYKLLFYILVVTIMNFIKNLFLMYCLSIHQSQFMLIELIDINVRSFLCKILKKTSYEKIMNVVTGIRLQVKWYNNESIYRHYRFLKCSIHSAWIKLSQKSENNRIKKQIQTQNRRRSFKKSTIMQMLTIDSVQKRPQRPNFYLMYNLKILMENEMDYNRTQNKIKAFLPNNPKKRSPQFYKVQKISRLQNKYIICFQLTYIQTIYYLFIYFIFDYDNSPCVILILKSNENEKKYSKDYYSIPFFLFLSLLV